MVLVGGEGTRLRPLTETTPKQLLPIAGVPMLERVLAQLSAAGVTEAVLSLGYRPDAFLAAYPDGEAAGVRLRYAVEPELLDTAGAIGFAARQESLNETFVVVNGDVLTDLDITSLVGFHRDHTAQATISLTPVDDPSRYGVVSTDEAGRVVAFVEKPPVGLAPTNLINAGTYVIEPSVLDRIPDGRRVSVERETFPLLVAEGSLYAVPADSYWLDAGTPETYLQAQIDLLDGSRTIDPLPDGQAISPGVWTRGAPDIRGNVFGPSLVDDRAVVAEGATVISSVVGVGAVVESGARVEGSVLLAGSRVAEGATVFSSVVGFGAIVSPGCRITGHTLIGDGAVLDPGEHIDGGRLSSRIPS